jgi:hypothetical protein
MEIKARELDQHGGAATTMVNVYETMYDVYPSLSIQEQRLALLQQLLTNLSSLIPLCSRDYITLILDQLSSY